MPTLVGLNSGSSVDSIDVAIIDIDMGDDGLPVAPTVRYAAEVEWPEEVRALLIDAIDGKLDIYQISRLNFAVGYVYGTAAAEAIAQAGLAPGDIMAIGTDGQTLAQEAPRREDLTSDAVADWLTGTRGHTFQIGDGAVTAAVAGVDVVTRFRPADIALGGNGAPIEQYMDYLLYRGIAPLITLNIGGIANIHAISADPDQVMAFDTGPGNILIDRFMRLRFGQAFDRDGATAASGTVVPSILDHLMQHPFLRRTPPRSAWREDFDASYLADVLDRFEGVDDHDMAATLTEFTSRTIVDALHEVPYLDQVGLLVGNGGGLLNATLRKSLERQVPKHMKIVLSDEFGIPAKGNEAAKFATLAYSHLVGLPANFPSSSGARTRAILGQHHHHP